MIIDGDGMVSGHQSKGSLEVKQLCHRYGIPCHILTKREAENYLPNTALEAWARKTGKRKIVRAFVALRVRAKITLHSQGELGHYGLRCSSLT